MRRIEQPDWQRRRSEFNHQWLKNKLLSALDSAANLMRGRIQGAGYLEEVLSGEVREWTERRRDLETLLRDFETEMSPSKLFEAPPLLNWEYETKATMSRLLCQLWWIRYPVQTWIGDARLAAQSVDESYERLAQVRPVAVNGRIDSEFAKCFVGFQEACRVLAKAMERFPNEILIT